MLEEAEEGSGGVLTVREMEILLLVSRGLSNTQVATSLRLLRYLTMLLEHIRSLRGRRYFVDPAGEDPVVIERPE
jgi:ATP/maltotriose-dependent transcriptional regulator MalT